MAQAGYLATVQMGPTSYTTIADVTTAEIQVGVEIYDVTALGDRWKKQITGVASYTLKIDGNFNLSDADQAALQASVITNPGTIISWKIYPAGVAGAGSSYSGTAIIKTLDIKIDLKAQISVAWDFEGTGAVVYGP